jgi:hypothetical protein
MREIARRIKIKIKITITIKIRSKRGGREGHFYHGITEAQGEGVIRGRCNITTNSTSVGSGGFSRCAPGAKLRRRRTAAPGCEARR